MIILENLKTERKENPIGVPTSGIRFSYEVKTDKKDNYQTAYQIIVKDSQNIVWDSGKVLSKKTSGIKYQGVLLKPRTKYIWKVKIYTSLGEESQFSNEQSFETALSINEWESFSFISGKNDTLPLLRKAFNLKDKKIISGRVYICGLGSYNLFLNGKRVSDILLQPMVTRYHKRYMFNTYDITNLLNNGENAFAVMLSNGYYSMHGNGVDWQKDKWANAPWADKPKCKLIAYITYDDQTEQVISTDQSWAVLPSPLVVDEAYYGEEYDNRLYINGFDNIGLNDSAFPRAIISNPPLGNPEPQLAEGCKVIEEKPLKLVYNKDNEYLFDAGEILVGWAKINLLGNKDDEIEVSYSEWLDDDGNFSDKFLLSPWDFKGRKRKPQTDYFILNGNGEENFAPLFHYKGFRYIRVRTNQGVKIKDIKAQVVHADLTHTGNFECSNDFINNLHFVCKKALLNNLHGYPSDTPVYEKMGYLADGYLTQEMAHYNFDCFNYYEKWARDIIDQVKENGYIEQTAPMWDEDKENAPEWSVGLAIVPYQIYKITGDNTLMIESYEKAKKLLAYQMSLTIDNISTSMWGDHVSSNGKVIREISATAFLFYTANILSESALLQGKIDEKEEFDNLAKDIKTSFNKYFFNKEKGYYTERNSDEFLLNAQILPYAFGLIDDNKIESVESAIKNTKELCGGIFSIKYLFLVLTNLGLQDRLYDFITKKDCPSWGYWLSFNENSLWEQWGLDTRSRNHHMFGTVDEWLYKGVGGLEIINENTLSVNPYFAPQLQWAKASVNLESGKAKCIWQRKNGEIIVNLEIPFNASAKVNLSTKLETKNLLLGSGNYHFTIKE